MSRDVGQGRFPYIEPGTVPYIERMVQYRGMVVQYRDRLAFWACELFFPAPTDKIMLTDLTCVAAARRDVSERIVVMVSALWSRFRGCAFKAPYGVVIIFFNTNSRYCFITEPMHF